MDTTPLAGPCGIEVSAEDLAGITQLYDRGLYLQAYERARGLGPLSDWRGVPALLIGGRLANNLYAPELSNLLHSRAWRADRANPAAAYFRSLSILGRRGPLAAWKFLRDLPEFPGATPVETADLLTARAAALIFFRDFERAAIYLAEAEKLASDHAWLWVEKSKLAAAQDDYAGALELTQRAFAIQPWFRPAVQERAQLLQLVDRDDEALAFLTEASGHLESAAVVLQLSVLQTELGDHAAALASHERALRLAPLMEEGTRTSMEGLISDARYACGDLAGAIEAAKRAKSPFFLEIARRLEAPQSDGRRVRLAVPFVRQHHVTCAPATISALSRFLQTPIDHLALAEVICYDGTPDHVGRHWLEENGWSVREFRADRETAHALLDRGIPFALATVGTQNAHLQAIVGYDTLRGTLLIRDPYLRTHGEALAESFFERYASTGPQSMVILPRGAESRLDGLSLPESALYDHAYRLSRALHVHDRQAAQRHAEAMEAESPGHRLAIGARRSLASYDANRARLLACSEELLVSYPKDANLLLGKLAMLRELTRQGEYRDFLRQLAETPDADPIFWREWAQELSCDARQHPAARRLLLRTLRFRPLDVQTLSALAHLLFAGRDLEEAGELYRLAACLADKVEHYSRSYFIAARHLRATDTALASLRLRVEKYGGKSSLPAQLLFSALKTLDRSAEAFEALEAALTRRPEDGGLLLFAAEAFARAGDLERSSALLRQAEPRVARLHWLRVSASLADHRCALPEALALWRAVLELDPLALDAHETAARLMAEVEGRAAARAHLQAACERFPHHVELRRFAVQWARDEGAASSEPLLRGLLELSPDDAWARRELALLLAGKRDFEAALHEADLAAALEPCEPATFAVRGRVLIEAGRHPDAREVLRQGLRLSIDSAAAMSGLLEACDSFEERREAIRFVQEELVRQVVFGEGLLTFRNAAYPILEPEELLASLREAQAARPDLWHAWSALVRQLVDMRQLPEALALAEQAVERFPLQPRVWLDLAEAHRARGEREEEIRPLQRALLLQPAWGYASRALAGVYQRGGEYEEAARILEEAVGASPLDQLNHGMLADTLWRLGRKAGALARIEQALRINPSYDWAWQALNDWSTEEGQAGRAAELAEELTRLRPAEERSWYILAQCLPDAELERRLAALDRALALNPLFEEAWDVRATVLTAAGRFEEAVAACEPPSWTAEARPMMLGGRRAWIEAARGNTQAAIERMETVLQTSPDYYWGWSRLCDWCCARGLHERARAAAKQMARLAPRSALPLGHIADVQARLGDKAEAIKTLRGALEIDPAYFFAAATILDSLLDEKRFDEAERMLEHFRVHLPGAPALSVEVRLRRLQGRNDEAKEGLRRLCFVPSQETPSLTAAAETFLNLSGMPVCEDLFCALLSSPGTNPEVGAFWVRCFTGRGRWEERHRLYELDPATPIGRRARVAYLSATQTLANKRFFQGLMERDREALRRDPELWGMVGCAYVSLGQPREAAQWLADWPDRSGVRPWMLSNLVLALQDLGRRAEAAEVSRRALELPSDHTTHQHQLWIAYDAAMAGGLALASRQLAETRYVEMKPFHQALRTLVSGLVAVQAAPQAERKAIYAAREADLLNPKFFHCFQDRSLRGAYERGLAAMARAAGVRPSRKARRVPKHKSEQAAKTENKIAWRALIFVAIAASRLVTQWSNDSSTPSLPNVEKWMPPATQPSRAPGAGLGGRPFNLDPAPQVGNDPAWDDAQRRRSLPFILPPSQKVQFPPLPEPLPEPRPDAHSSEKLEPPRRLTSDLPLFGAKTRPRSLLPKVQFPPLPAASQPSHSEPEIDWRSGLPEGSTSKSNR